MLKDYRVTVKTEGGSTAELRVASHHRRPAISAAMKASSGVIRSVSITKAGDWPALNVPDDGAEVVSYSS